MKILAWLFLCFALTLHLAFADTPPPGTVKIKDTGGGDINATAGALNVNLSSTTAVQPVSASALPLPTNAAQETGGNLASLVSSSASINAKLGTLGQKNMAGSAPVVIASDQAAVPVSGSVSVSNFPGTQPVSGTFWQATQPVSVSTAIPTKTPVNANGSSNTSTTIGTTASTFTAPANAVGFILEASSSNAQNLRWALGSAATTSAGLRLEPGRDTGFVPASVNVSVASEAGSAQEAEIVWVLSQ